MDFTIPDELIDLGERTERFVKEEILPREGDKRQTPHGPTEAFRHELVALARAAGLLSPHVASEWGGLGLDHRGKAVVFEAAGYAPLATIAMNIFAPDEANMHLLEEIADERQKEAWLRPLAAGRIRSCFMMTEPAPGAGADPSMLLTTARRAGGNSGDFRHRRHEMADHRRDRRRIRDHHGEDRRGSARPGRRDDVPGADERAGHPCRAGARHPRPVHDRRPCGSCGSPGSRSRKARCSAGSARASAMPRRGLPRRA